MTWDYAEKKIKEALHLTRGNEAQARQQVMNWAMDDAKLLRELVRPHMVGITAHAVGRVVSGKSKPEPLSAAPSTQSEAEDAADSFGMDILRAIAGGDTAQFGQENYSRPVKRQGASQQHIDAIRQMISKNSSSED